MEIRNQHYGRWKNDFCAPVSSQCQIPIKKMIQKMLGNAILTLRSYGGRPDRLANDLCLAGVLKLLVQIMCNPARVVGRDL